jgi:hypothetical protein
MAALVKNQILSFDGCISEESDLRFRRLYC